MLPLAPRIVNSVSMREENSAWDSFFVAGAVFGEVGGCCLSHRAL